MLIEQTMLFFFSSRRRHTRLQGDWSSDVCSSDLSIVVTAATAVCSALGAARVCTPSTATICRRCRSATRNSARSEERRVGKEGRAGGEAAQSEAKEVGNAQRRVHAK